MWTRAVAARSAWITTGVRAAMLVRGLLAASTLEFE
jgi:hypothetical protein